MQRADGYGTGFLRSGAKAVFANGRGSLSSILTDLLTSDESVASDLPRQTGRSRGERDFTFPSQKTPGRHGLDGSVRQGQVLQVGQRQHRR